MEIEKEILNSMIAIVGEPLTDMWRYAGFQKFEFGRQLEFVNRKGQVVTRANIDIVAGTAWKLFEKSKLILSNRSFLKDGVRKDAHAFPVYDRIQDVGLKVLDLSVLSDGGVNILMDGFELHLGGRESLRARSEFCWRFTQRQESQTLRMILGADGLERLIDQDE